MENGDIYERRSLICLALSVHIIQIGALTDAYLGGFDREDFFVFSDSEEQNKLYKKEYYAFTHKLPEVIAAANGEAARLSALLSEADENGAPYAISLIGENIEAYLAFERAMSEYSSESRAAISEKKISPLRLVTAARKLRSAIDTLLSSLGDKDKNG